MKPKAWSYSALNGFTTCPRQYYEINVAKTVPYVQNEAARWGDQVHKQIEDHIKGIKNLNATNMSEGMKHRVFSTLESLDEAYDITAEGKLALSKDLKPCTFFAKDTWVRAILDVKAMHKDGTEIVVIDWKTGKVKPDINQLKLFALFMFYHHPNVEKVDTVLEWLAYNDSTRETYRRDQIPMLWQSFLPDLTQFKKAFNTDTWPERPSGLCSKWCDVLSCKYNGRNK